MCLAGDTVGIAFDQSDEKLLRIYHNGQYLSDQDVRGMKGETWPVVIVAGGASLEVSAAANETTTCPGLLRVSFCVSFFVSFCVCGVCRMRAGELRDCRVCSSDPSDV